MAAILKDINASSFTTEAERKEALVEAHALISRIETPWDTVCRLVLAYPNQVAALKIASDLGLFAQWLEKNNGSPMLESELLKLVKCDAELFPRIIRHLAATDMLWIDESGRYEMPPFARSLVERGNAIVFDNFVSLFMPLALNLPKFLEHTKYQDPTNDETNCKHWSGQDIWEILAGHQKTAEDFNRYMKVSATQRGHFTELLPCEDLGCNKEDTLVVDIGGSLGHDMQGFKDRYPKSVGRVVIQDLPHVVADAKKSSNLDKSIELQEYDFFTPQNIKGAKFYLLHAILHDWHDTAAKQILEMLRPALKKGYSKLLIHEVVVSTVKPDPESTGRDWVMMYFCSGKERTEQQWESLLSSAGFKINKIWRNPRYAEALIETEAV